MPQGRSDLQVALSLTNQQYALLLPGSCAASAKRSLAAQMVPSTGCKMLVYLVSFTPKNHDVPFRGPRSFYPKKSPCSSLGPQTPALIYGERIALYLVSFTPKTHDVPFWGPRSPARSRYCASPEASIMRLKAAAKLSATASLLYTQNGFMSTSRPSRPSPEPQNHPISPSIQAVHHFFIKR